MSNKKEGVMRRECVSVCVRRQSERVSFSQSSVNNTAQHNNASTSGLVFQLTNCRRKA
jgi:hypothetical protein